MTRHPKKILFAHNYYLSAGGEDHSHLAEIEMFKKNNIHVERYEENNIRIKKMGYLSVAIRTIWSQETYKNIRKILRNNGFDSIISQNTFPLISPSIYYAARIENVPIFQFIRNYRILCLNATFFRQGRICELCLKRKFKWPGIINRCYHGSFRGSFVVAQMIFLHWIFRTWDHILTKYICLNNFSKQKLIQGGIPEEKITIRPNFLLVDPGTNTAREDYLLYVGRLSEEKGIKMLIKTIEEARLSNPIRIVGDGPLKDDVIEIANRFSNVNYMGQVSNERVIRLLKKAHCLLVPSVWYEGMPRIIIEAFATGTVVIGSDIGGIAELITHGENGLLFKPEIDGDFEKTVNSSYQDTDLIYNCRLNARKKFLSDFSSDLNFMRLLEILSVS